MWGHRPKYILGLGLVRGGTVDREQTNSKEGARTRTSQASYGREGQER